MGALHRLTALALAWAATGCAHGKRFDPRARPTCLVLSVGGADGVAHLGAIAAIKSAKLPISCVVGTSMGALVGAVYATDPDEETTARFRRLVAAYAKETRTVAQWRGLGYALFFGAAAAVLTSGVTLPPLAAGAGYALGIERTPRMDRERLEKVMGRFFGDARIEDTRVPYATLYHRAEGGGVTLERARSGSLAAAVGASVANPFLFPALDVREARTFDPGADRVAAVPVEDACRLFPGSNLLAVNVSGAPPFHKEALPCPVREVRIPPTRLAPEAVVAFGAAFDRAVRAGYEATRRALAED